MIVAPLTQQDRLLTFQTPNENNRLFLRSVKVVEKVSSLYTMHLELLSEVSPVGLDEILGQPVSVSIDDGGECEARHFHGIVSQFAYSGCDRRFHYYSADVVPWLWMLTRTSDCRVFQEMTVPQIVEKVFRDRGFDDFRTALGPNYAKLDYCVQYRESDFSFVSRLMEREGIYYYFEHEANRHVLVLADSPRAHRDCPGQATLRFEPIGGASHHERSVRAWRELQQVRSGEVLHRDYSFQTPDNPLEFAERTVVELPMSRKLRLYDYPGEYAERFNLPGERLGELHNEGRKLTRIRMEEEESQHAIMTGESDCPSLTAGGRFKLLDFPESGDNRGPFMITAVEHFASQEGVFTSGQESSREYRNCFTCMLHQTQYRPCRSTPAPVVHGPQTAVVVGPPGEEIHVDKFGRIKVQFHWDREGKKNQHSSCYVRVAQSIAGKRWGSYFWPRIGQEVVVEFLEGDPDQPIVVGCVYNANQMPPYIGDGLDPKHKHNPRLSGFKSNSSQGGEGFNELRFDDTKGQEQVFLHAERAKDERVGADSLEFIGNDRHLYVGANQREHVEGDKHQRVKGTLREHIQSDMLLQVDGSQDITVFADKRETLNANLDLSIESAFHEKVGNQKTVTVGSDLTQSIGGGFRTEAASEVSFKANHFIGLSSGACVRLKGPGGFIEINDEGIIIEGSVVKINCGGSAEDAPGVEAIEPAKAGEPAPESPQLADGSVSGQPSAPNAKLAPPKKPAPKPNMGGKPAPAKQPSVEPGPVTPVGGA